jgi:AdoMet-dependent rRNA methyltransferase SPB1
VERQNGGQLEGTTTEKEDNEDDSDDDAQSATSSTPSEDQEEDEDAIQDEIQKLRLRKQRERKKQKKKERKLLSKKRKQAALGMDLNAIDVQEHDQFFSLSTLQSAGDLDQVAEVNLDQVTEEQAFGKADEDSDDDSDNDEKNKKDEDTGYSYRLERDLDFAYERYLETTKNGEAKVGTKASKRSKKLMREKLAQESHEDHELLLTNQAGLDQDTKTYAKMLQGPKDSDDEDDSSDDDEDQNGDNGSDGYDDEPMTPEEHHAKKKQKLLLGLGNASSNPLIHKFQDEPTSAKTARWFSNPLFAQIGQAVNEATTTPAVPAPKEDRDQDSDDDDESDDDVSVASSASESEQGDETTRAKKKQKKSSQEGMDADDVLALMPKTDKQKRHEKRIKAKERDERRQKREAKKLGEAANDFDLVAGMEEEEDDEDEMMHMEGMSEEKKKKLMEARKLIKAGIGANASNGNGKDRSQFEVVEQDRPLPVKDTRKFDSDHEDYDSDDYAKTMALGTMMLRQSKAKALVDASYNRFAWNDPEDLPEWFVDDENRHYRPQLPIPPALLAKMKEKMAALSTKPIAKVAEARARKNRRAKLKLATAKKKAQAVANSTDMTEAMKLKSISKALRSEDGKKGGKQYIVAKKGQGKKGVRGATMVDKRLKSDKRSMDRATNKRKGSKKGGLVGSKRRRHHK